MAEKKLTLGSLFDGSGGFMLAGVLAGIEPIWKSEIEPFPIAVTNARFPKVKHYGDVSLLNGAELPPVDVISGGFPCQSVSIAGKRDGVKHIEHGGDKTTRSGLFYEGLRVIKEMSCATDGKYPRYIVLDNVTGLLSSNIGEDFREILESISQIK
ncbi:MAG: DNA cytosine methyltransferase, partial [Firmicutes bacterium]|nr:DNA cytosine methyltransferase [Bacillota bacterium]